MHDAIVRGGAKVERCIIDKEVKVGRRAVVGLGDARVVNARYPQHVYSGLTVIGKIGPQCPSGRSSAPTASSSPTRLTVISPTRSWKLGDHRERGLINFDTA